MTHGCLLLSFSVFFVCFCIGATIHTRREISVSRMRDFFHILKPLMKLPNLFSLGNFFGLNTSCTFLTSYPSCWFWTYWPPAPSTPSCKSSNSWNSSTSCTSRTSCTCGRRSVSAGVDGSCRGSTAAYTDTSRRGRQACSRGNQKQIIMLSSACFSEVMLSPGCGISPKSPFGRLTLLWKRLWRGGVGYWDMGWNTPGGPEIHRGKAEVYCRAAISISKIVSAVRFQANGEDAWWTPSCHWTISQYPTPPLHWQLLT